MSSNQDALNDLARFTAGTRVTPLKSGPWGREVVGTIQGTALMQTGPPSGTMTLDLIVRVEWDNAVHNPGALQYSHRLELAS